MTFAATAVQALEDIFGPEAVAALGRCDGRRAHAAVALLSWVVLLLGWGAPDDVIDGAVRALVGEVREARRIAEGAPKPEVDATLCDPVLPRDTCRARAATRRRAAA